MAIDGVYCWGTSRTCVYGWRHFHSPFSIPAHFKAVNIFMLVDHEPSAAETRPSHSESREWHNHIFKLPSAFLCKVAVVLSFLPFHCLPPGSLVSRSPSTCPSKQPKPPLATMGHWNLYQTTGWTTDVHMRIRARTQTRWQQILTSSPDGERQA